MSAGSAAPAPGAAFRVLVCLDASRDAPSSLHRFVTLARDRGLELVFVHVLDPADMPAFFDQRYDAAAWREAFVRDRCAPELRQGAPVELRIGMPAAEILDVARTANVDMIVVGTPTVRNRVRPEAVQALRQLGDPIVVVLAGDARGPTRGG